MEHRKDYKDYRELLGRMISTSKTYPKYKASTRANFGLGTLNLQTLHPIPLILNLKTPESLILKRHAEFRASGMGAPVLQSEIVLASVPGIWASVSGSHLDNSRPGIGSRVQGLRRDISILWALALAFGCSRSNKQTPLLSLQNSSYTSFMRPMRDLVVTNSSCTTPMWVLRRYS